MPFLKQYHFVIETRNTFPHSSGIASSASGMSVQAIFKVNGKSTFKEEFVTAGGFNFQNAWTGAHIVAKSI